MRQALLKAASLFSPNVLSRVAAAMAAGPTFADETVGECLRRALPSEVYTGDIVAMLTLTMCESPSIADWGGAGSPAPLPTRALLGLPPPLHHHAAPTARSSQRAVEMLAQNYQQRKQQLQQAAASSARAAATQHEQLHGAKQAEAERQRRLAFEQAERERLAREVAAAQVQLASAYEAAQTHALAQKPKPRGINALRAATHKVLLEKMRQGKWVSSGTSAPATAAEQNEIDRREAAHAARSR
jgi:hypothetical protein